LKIGTGRRLLEEENGEKAPERKRAGTVTVSVL
jgi:hypothetical protein